MSEPTDLADAEARARAARRRLAGTVATIRHRLSPRTIARGAVADMADRGERAIETGVAAAERHPLPLAGAVAAVTAFLFRKRIGGLFARLSKKRDGPAKPVPARRVRSATPRPAAAKRKPK